MESKPESVDIIIAVYNALDYVKKSIASVLEKDAGYKFRLLVIDDKSPDSEIKKFLKTVKDPRVEVFYNDENLGYSGTNNRGMKYSTGDVVLLNSDTEVTEGWLKQLVDCAYSNDQIGTVSPFTNSGAGLLNVPDFYYKSNPIPEGYNLDSWGKTFNDISIYSYPTTLTNVGYCMYIKRKVIDSIGYLDMDTYGKGYGEDNDYCLRAHKAGFLNINDDSTFIQHEGGRSFATQQEKYTSEALVFKNDKVVEKKYPEVRAWLDRVLEEGPTTPMHQNWWFHQNFFSSKQRILHVVRDSVDNAKGGIEQIIKQIVKYNDEYDNYILYWDDKKACILKIWDENKKSKPLYVKGGFKKNNYKLNDKKFDSQFKELINLIKPKVVHFHSVLGYPISMLLVPNSLGIDSILHIHDFSFFYPPYWDLSLSSSIQDNINENINKIESSNLREKESLYYKNRSVLIKTVLQNVDMIIAPSEFVKEKTVEFNNAAANKIKVVPNPVDVEVLSSKNGTNSKLAIGFIGTFTKFKGANEFLSLIKKDEEESFDWVVAGPNDEFKDELGQFKNLELIDSFDHKKIAEILNKIDVVLLPLQCAETFNLVLHEALKANKYVICTYIGAPGNIVKTYDLGKVFSRKDYISKAWNTLLELDKDRSKLSEFKENISNYKFLNAQEVVAQLKKIYDSFKHEDRKFDIQYKKKLNNLRVKSIIETNRLIERQGYSKKRKLIYKVIDIVSDQSRGTILHRPIKKIFSKLRKSAKI
ncbi:glycosyltransferase [Candidatus Dojkabacteria bacterium]|uniref:Glycosyltransferase n=1 Tax=Candidatus Dojkabacteria bacterium TaxID=2099670 RepID=A0A955L2R0_9BACT|nr:glycosyltransferase [Candidatus Dojkabacteria bacterium]